MKKTIVMTIIFVMVLLSFANIVRADAEKTATVSIAGSSEVKTDDTVTVTVSIEPGDVVLGAHFLVKYDANYLQYVRSNATAANGKTPGVVDVEVINVDGVDSCTITFKVVGTEGSTEVTATPVEFTSGTTEADIMNIGSIAGSWKVSIVKEELPVEPADPTIPEEPEASSPAEPTTPAQPATPAQPSTNTQQPTKYPPTGYNVAPMLIAGLAVILVAVIVRFRKISK